MAPMIWLQVFIVLSLFSVGFDAAYSRRKLYEEKPKTPSCGVPSLMTPSQIDEMLVSHNEIRRQFTAADQFEVKWDENLAARAQEWANQCTWGHGMTSDCEGNSVGQNGWAGSGSSFTPAGVCASWASESSNWDFTAQSCKEGVCGHWVQMVTSRTRLIGCGVSSCPDSNWKTQVYCNYDPGTKYPPYKPGAPCSACHEQTFGSGGYQCVDQLCVECDPAQSSDCQCGPLSLCQHGSMNEATCKCECDEGYFGIKCESQCADIRDQDACEYWKDLDYCEESSVYYGFMKDNCVKTCGLCSPTGKRSLKVAERFLQRLLDYAF